MYIYIRGILTFIINQSTSTRVFICTYKPFKLLLFEKEKNFW